MVGFRCSKGGELTKTRVTRESWGDIIPHKKQTPIHKGNTVDLRCSKGGVRVESTKTRVTRESWVGKSSSSEVSVENGSDPP